MKTRLLLAVALVAAMLSAAAAGEPFSRARWIEREMRTRWFSGGVIPNDRMLPVPRVNPGTARGIPGLVRVSHDLLPSFGGSQPETQAEPYIAANPNNSDNLIATWQESRFADGGARCLAYATSTDGGATWSEGLPPHLTVANGGDWDRASDPWVAFGPGNRAYFISLLFNEQTPDNAVGMSVSTDGGLSWADPVIVSDARANFNDKESVAADAFLASPHSGNVYAAWDINVANTQNQRLVVSRSTDGGQTWNKPVKVRGKGNNVGVIPRVAPDGTVYVVWNGIKAGTTYVMFSRSTDGGLTWSKFRLLEPIRSRGVAEFRSGNGLPSFDVDPLTGALYVAWTDGRWGPTDQVTMISSTDGGATWTPAQQVSTGPSDAPVFTVAVAAQAGGGVAVSYYSLQNDPERRYLADVYVRRSPNGGATWLGVDRLTDSSFDMRFAAQARGYFLGDYAGLAGTQAGYHALFVAPLLPSAIEPTRFQPDAFVSSAVN
ncbi:MAG TPA: sialidase family protein [Blastocatellia bacterium]|nr:sialidase family protein [Blastocatellia bacterium]